jgi:hypothetical protein
MNVHIQLLRHPNALRTALRGDGWRLDDERPDSVVARHPAVPDESAARNRLHHLGLLTSSSLRIDFHQPR